MTSPDVRPYVDLTLLDVTPDQLAEAAIAVLAGQLPGWQPREGNVEVMLLEANAAITAELVAAVNRMPGAVLETLLRLFGADRSLGYPATATVTVQMADALGHTLPAGTRFRLAIDDTVDPVDFALDNDLVIPGASSSGTAEVTALTATPNANGTAAATPLQILDPIGAVSAVLASSPVGGSNPEDGAAFLERATALLGRLTSTLVLPDHFTARALEQAPTVYRATTIDRYDADTETADTNGHVTVAVAGPAGTEVDAGERETLRTLLAAQALASLTIHVIPATITPVAVYAHIAVKAGADPAATFAAVEAALEDYLNPDTWGWSGTVRRNELISVVDRADGVDYVVELYDAEGDPWVDLELTGVGNLVDAITVIASDEAPAP